METAEASRDGLSATAVVTIALYADAAFCGVSVDPDADTYSAHVAILQALEGAAENTRALIAALKAAEPVDTV